MDSAWMIRNDGKAIPCVQHIYANPADAEETLFAAEWLYINTRRASTQTLVLQTLAAWLNTILSSGNPLKDALSYIARRPYRFLSSEFVETHLPKITSIPAEGLCLNVLCEEIAAELNQEFLRARYGGMYHTDPDSSEIYFRISSIGFDWGGIIREFIRKVPPGAVLVSIVRDAESTGAENAFYCSRIPLNEFLEQNIALTISHECISEMNRRILTEIAGGASLRQLQSLPINTGRLAQKLRILAHLENEHVLIKYSL